MINTRKTSILVEKYRPTSFDEFIGNDIFKQKMKQYIDTQDIPNLLFSGPPGCGKTSAAKILVNSIECDHIMINASDKGGIDFIRTDIIPFASSVGFKDLKIIVLDEMDFCSAHFMAALRQPLEAFSRTTRFILTANYLEKIIDPIKSRCQLFPIYTPSKAEVGKRLVDILEAENIKYNVDDLVTIVNAGYPDIRSIINLAQQQTVNNELKIDKQAITDSDYKQKVVEYLKDNNNKKDTFKNIRHLIADNQVKSLSDHIFLSFS